MGFLTEEQNMEIEIRQKRALLDELLKDPVVRAAMNAIHLEMEILELEAELEARVMDDIADELTHGQQ